VDRGQVRKRPATFRALGNDEPPVEVSIGGETYRCVSVFKHDSWAATALYANDNGEQAICKFNRRQPIGIVPMRWLGRTLASREAGFLQRLSDVELVPRDLGPVSVDGKVLPYAMARTYIEGTAFRLPEQVDTRFFEHLREALTQIHQHDMAYVDFHKRENILIAEEDGRPYFLDFQVSYGLKPGWLGSGPVARYVLRQMQDLDEYHFRKHVAKCCPEALTEEERQKYLELTPLVRAHRRIAKPFKFLRMKLLIALRIRDKTGSVESEYEPEIAFRTPPEETGAASSAGTERPPTEPMSVR
jgi:hypothetical protein